MLSHPLSVKHLITVAALTRGDVMQLIGSAGRYARVVKRTGSCDDLKGCVMASLFYEPSTRTSCSFKAAMLRLGGDVIDVDVNTCSMQKGETFSDTVRTLSTYADCVAIRHPKRNSMAMAAASSTVPIINCGEGDGEHPTQALLDVYTIHEEIGFDCPINIGILGDLKHSRTVHSLILCLSKVSRNITFYLVAPDTLELPSEYLVSNVQFVEKACIEDCIELLDVLYVTRIQEERFSSKAAYQSVKDSYIVDEALMRMAKKKMIVMHPLPRKGEIAKEVDRDSRAAYFRQMRYGMFMRMAILSKMMMRIRFYD